MLYTSPSQALSSAPPAASSTSSPVSPPRSGRLRGLSYLRSYTHNHLHLRSTSPEPDSTTVSQAARPSPRRANTEGAAGVTRLVEHAFPASPTRHTREQHQQQQPRSATSRTPSPLRANGWLPATGVAGGSARPTTQLQPAVSRARAIAMHHDGQVLDATAATTDPTLTLSTSAKQRLHAGKPTIQFIPYNDISARSRPSLDFARISRTLPHPTSVIKVGRYSERDSNTEAIPSRPSDYPVGFKSKVVSRKHCEFWCEGEQWYVRDVGSSSGTFLNYVRLSPPGIESRPFLIKDSDVVQLGIDFKGGEEMIFRCVKMRLECNRGLLKTVNKFNKSTHKQLRKLTGAALDAAKPDDASRSSTECTICLNSIAPCQALFVAPCSHTWHYKCIRKLLEAPPVHEFTCPNCRAQAYLNADVDDPDEYAESIDSRASDPDQALPGTESQGRIMTESPEPESSDYQRDLTCVAGTLRPTHIDASGSAHEHQMDNLVRSRTLEPSRVPQNSSRDSSSGQGSDDRQPMSTEGLHVSAPLDIPRRAVDLTRTDEANPGRARTPSASAANILMPDLLAGAGPLTPRNNAGPFVLDGDDSDPRLSVEGRHEMTNLNSIVRS